VPRLKPIGDIFISVLLADLVLLQAAWKLFVLLVDKILVHRHPEARYCEGCLESQQDTSDDMSKVVHAPSSQKGGIMAATTRVWDRHGSVSKIDATRGRRA